MQQSNYDCVTLSSHTSYYVKSKIETKKSKHALCQKNRKTIVDTSKIE